MCGIAGAYSLERDFVPADKKYFESAKEILFHRGPDQGGVFASDKAMLANTRLSIQDLRAVADLPMRNATDDIWITYNGEVSNFLELRQKFRLDEDYQFKSKSDTEVVLRLYEKLGIDFVKHLSGMFAFSIFDKRKEKAYIVRDFYGINPLFYAVKGGRLYFSSELKAFFEYPDFEPELNPESMYHFFSLAYIPGELTPYQGIEELQGGRLLEVDLKTGKYENRSYYELVYEPNYDLTEDEAADQVHELLLDSVRRNMISEAPLGTTLSGGVDTSTLVCLAKELGLSKGLKTFSIKMGEHSFDESPYQRLVSKFAETDHHEILVGPDEVAQCLIEHMAFLDEPVGDGSAIPSFILARKARQHVKVLLSGEGGDEVFNAYETHGAHIYRKMYRKFFPKPLRSVIFKAAHLMPTNYKKLSIDFMAKRFTEGAEMGPAEAHLYWRHVLTEDEKKQIMPRHSDYRATDQIFADLYNQTNYKETLNRISLIDIKHFFIGDLMVKNDRMFMASSIETRFPFMDRLLIDYVRTIPPSMRIKGLKRRYIQKHAMRNSLPKEILNRGNFGLEMPNSLWLVDDLRGFIDRYITKARVERTEILDYEAISAIWSAHKRGVRDYGRAMWCILLFMIWFDMYIYERDYKKYLSN